MIIVDANLLLYAYNPSCPEHARALKWFETIMAGTEPIGLPWVSLLAFLRISTNARAYPHPLSMSEASDIVATWLGHPGVSIVHPTDRHWAVMAPLMAKARVKGPLVTDAHLAALSMEHGALLCSCDADFARFGGLRWEDPLG